MVSMVNFDVAAAQKMKQFVVCELILSCVIDPFYRTLCLLQPVAYNPLHVLLWPIPILQRVLHQEVCRVQTRERRAVREDTRGHQGH